MIFRNAWNNCFTIIYSLYFEIYAKNATSIYHIHVNDI